MAELKNKKKLATSAVALTTAAALLLGGTLAWQSISQEALNVAAGDVNPGGRLHDDFNGSNKDVYVENFADEDIFARVRLDEYFEYGQDAGKNFDTDSRAVEIITENAIWNDKTTWTTHMFDGTDATANYWTWETGGSTVYMPTFNMNKDSLEADINGTFEGSDGTDGVSDGDTEDRYSDYDTYNVGDTLTGPEIYDADTNDIDEFADDADDAAVIDVNYTEKEGIHTAKSTLGATLMSMQEWIDAGSQLGEYWVYDTDGWVYWAQPIKPDTATGLLLDGISLTGVVDDNWYYGINVVGQFITANDIGADDNTGFYTDGSPTAEAIELLKTIGVNVDGSTIDGGETGTGGDGEGSEQGGQRVDALLYNEDTYIDTIRIGNSASLTAKDDSGTELNVTSWSISSVGSGELDAGTTIDENGKLTVADSETVSSISVFGTLDDGNYISETVWVEYPYVGISEVGDTDTKYLAPGESVTFQVNNLHYYFDKTPYEGSAYSTTDITLSAGTDNGFESSANYEAISNADGTLTLTHKCTSAEECTCGASVTIYAEHKSNSNIYGHDSVVLCKNTTTIETMHVLFDGKVYTNNESGDAHEVTVNVNPEATFINYQVGECSYNDIDVTIEPIDSEGSVDGITMDTGVIYLDTNVKPTGFKVTFKYMTSGNASDISLSETVSTTLNVTLNYQ